MDSLALYIYAAVGAVILWVKLRREKRRAYILSGVAEEFIENKKLCLVVEMVLFVGVGSFICVGIFGPATPAQAFAAGMGWTGFATGATK